MRAVGCLDDSPMVASVKMAHPLTGSMQLVTYIVCKGGGGGGGGYRFDYYLLYLPIDGNERNTGVLTCMRAVGCLDDSSMVASVKMAHLLTGSMQLVA